MKNKFEQISLKPGFMQHNGLQSVPIGNEKVDRYFEADADTTDRTRFYGSVDPTKTLYILAYPGQGNASQQPNKLLIFNYMTGEWSRAEVDVDLVFMSQTQGLSLEDLDTVSTSIDTLPESLDHSRWQGGQYKFAAIDADQKYAEFDGANLLDGSLTYGVRFLANAEADAFVTLSTRDLSLGGGIIDLTLSSNLLNMTDAAAALTDLNNSISQVNSALGALGSQAKQIEAHNGFVSRLMDTVESGIGNLVDADLAKESARLTALQVQQQLGVQALSIANQAPQVILSLFRGG